MALFGISSKHAICKYRSNHVSFDASTWAVAPWLGHDYWLRQSIDEDSDSGNSDYQFKKTKGLCLVRKVLRPLLPLTRKRRLHMNFAPMTTCNSLRERSFEYSTVCTIHLTETLDLIHNEPEFKILLSTDCLCWFQLQSASETPSLWVRWKIWMSMSKNMDALSAAYYCWCVRCKGCVVCSKAEADSLCEC